MREGVKMFSVGEFERRVQLHIVTARKGKDTVERPHRDHLSDRLLRVQTERGYDGVETMG